jgi:small conductance mechanosensitive channel
LSLSLITDFIPMILGFAYSLAIAVLVFGIGWIVSKSVYRTMEGVLVKRGVDVAASRFLARIAQYTVLAAALIASLGALGIETTSVIAILASAGLAVGLALQGSLSNFASGVMILMFRPFELNDVVTAGGHTGQVVDIGMFSLTMQTPDNLTIIVPNSGVSGSSIVNITKLGKRRMSIDVGVAYGVDLAVTMSVLKEAALASGHVLKEMDVGVALVGFGASSVDFQVHVWADNAQFIPAGHDVRVRLYNALEAANIEIPYDQVVLHAAPGFQALAAAK